MWVDHVDPISDPSAQVVFGCKKLQSEQLRGSLLEQEEPNVDCTRTKPANSCSCAPLSSGKLCPFHKGE